MLYFSLILGLFLTSSYATYDNYDDDYSDDYGDNYGDDYGHDKGYGKKEMDPPLPPKCEKDFPGGDYTLIVDALYDGGFEAAEALIEWLHVKNEDDYVYYIAQYVYDIQYNLIDTYAYPESLRFTLSLQDGRVIFDSAAGYDNTYARALGINNEDRINENLNTRVSVIKAQLSDCRIGYEKKESFTTGVDEVYVAIAVGPPDESLGTVRLSYAADCNNDGGYDDNYDDDYDGDDNYDDY